MTYLWRHVIWRATERICRRLAVFCEAEVGELDVPVVVDQDILRLQVAVNDVERVEVIQR